MAHNISAQFYWYWQKYNAGRSNRYMGRKSERQDKGFRGQRAEGATKCICPSQLQIARTTS